MIQEEIKSQLLEIRKIENEIRRLKRKKKKAEYVLYELELKSINQLKLDL